MSERTAVELAKELQRRLQTEPFQSAVLSDPESREQAVRKVTLRPVPGKTGCKLQLTRQESHRATHQNVPLPEVGKVVMRELQSGYRQLLLTDAHTQWHYRRSAKGRWIGTERPIGPPQGSVSSSPQMTAKTALVSRSESAVAMVAASTGSASDELPTGNQPVQMQPVPALRAQVLPVLQTTSADPLSKGMPVLSASDGSVGSHNRAKQYLLPEHQPVPFLISAGVMTPTGQVKAAMYHKFRQINRFLELVNNIVPSLSKSGTIRVVDFGCGKSYLTFALHHLLTVVHQRSVEMIGLDRKQDVVARCNEIACELDCTGLSFQAGEIREAPVSGHVDLAVALHACDTATDDALISAVRWNCSAILAVPCCQHELSKKLRAPDLAPLLRHGILQERFASLATDALRAQWLELHGYQAQIVEFIDTEHTPKNLLIRATRRSHRPRDLARRVTAYREFQHRLGLGETWLDQRARECGLELKLPADE